MKRFFLLVSTSFFLFPACTRGNETPGDGSGNGKSAAQERKPPSGAQGREGQSPGRGRGGQGGRAGGGRPAQVVEVFRAQKKEMPSVVSMPVVLEGRKQVEVYPRVAGRVTNISRQVGQKVTRGGTLFSIDRSEPGENYLAAPIVSPISGYVAEWFVREGDQVATGAPVVLVIDDSFLRAKIYLPVKDWQNITKKTTVTLSVGADTRPAEIVTVSRAVQATAGKGLVEVEVPNENGEWKAGFSATANVMLSPQPRLVIPARALLLTSDGSFVYTVEGEGNTLKRQKVEFVPRTSDEVEITSSDFPADSMVVVSGTSRLSEGANVKIAEKNAEGEGRKGP